MTPERPILSRLAELRERADYALTHVSQIQAQRAFRRAQEFLEPVREEVEFGQAVVLRGCE